MKVYFVSKRSDAENFMAWHESAVPLKKFEELGAIHVHADDFFTNHISDVKKDDAVVIHVSLKHDEHKDAFTKLDCLKGLRTLDAKSSDGIIHRKSLDTHDQWGNFHFWLVGTPNAEYNKVLADRGIRGISFTHCTDFDDTPPEEIFQQKQSDVLISGQMHEQFYPVRWRIFEAARSQNTFRAALLPHPGYEMDSLRHPYVGPNYVEFCKNFWLGAVGAGQSDGLHMKFLEFAKSYTLPIGNYPSYMDSSASSCIIQAGLGEPLEETNRIICEALRDKDVLADRIVRYSDAIREQYDVNVVVPQVYNKILRQDWDF